MKYRPLTPEEQRHWNDKVLSSVGGEVVVRPAIQYFRIEGGLARVLHRSHSYQYLDHHTGGWIPHSAVCDKVTGAHGDIADEISEDEARKLARRLAPGKKITWV